jgi:hypothetical protein
MKVLRRGRTSAVGPPTVVTRAAIERLQERKLGRRRLEDAGLVVSLIFIPLMALNYRRSGAEQREATQRSIVVGLGLGLVSAWAISASDVRVTQLVTSDDTNVILDRMDRTTTHLQKVAIVVGVVVGLLGAVIGGFAGALAATVIH